MITSLVGHSHDICAEAFGASLHLPGLILALIGLGRFCLESGGEGSPPRSGGVVPPRRSVYVPQDPDLVPERRLRWNVLAVAQPVPLTLNQGECTDAAWRGQER